MQRLLPTLLILVLLTPAAAFSEPEAAKDDLLRAGCVLRQDEPDAAGIARVIATCRWAVPAELVIALLRDQEGMARVMRTVAESRRLDDGRIVQVHTVGWPIDDRQVTLDVEETALEDGGVQVTFRRSARQAPLAPGRVQIPVDEGSWQIRPDSEGTRLAPIFPDAFFKLNVQGRGGLRAFLEIDMGTEPVQRGTRFDRQAQGSDIAKKLRAYWQWGYVEKRHRAHPIYSQHASKGFVVLIAVNSNARANRILDLARAAEGTNSIPRTEMFWVASFDPHSTQCIYHREWTTFKGTRRKLLVETPSTNPRPERTLRANNTT